LVILVISVRPIFILSRSQTIFPDVSPSLNRSGPNHRQMVWGAVPVFVRGKQDF